MFAQFEQLAPAEPKVTDMFDAPGDTAKVPEAPKASNGFDPFA
jgi:hypothetical protein